MTVPRAVPCPPSQRSRPCARSQRRLFFFPSSELAGNRKGPPRQELTGVPWAGPAVLRDFAFASASQVNARSEGAVRGLMEYLHFCIASHTLPPFLWVQFLHGTGLISGHLIYPQITPCPEGSASSPRTLLLIFLIPALSHPPAPLCSLPGAELQPAPTNAPSPCRQQSYWDVRRGGRRCCKGHAVQSPGIIQRRVSLKFPFTPWQPSLHLRIIRFPCLLG